MEERESSWGILGTAGGVLRLLGHPDRLLILEHLELRGASPLAAIAEELGLDPDELLPHLELLTRGKLVERRGDDAFVISEADVLTVLGSFRRKESRRRDDPGHCDKGQLKRL